MLRVGDLDRSIDFYQNVLGMKLLRRKDYPDGKFTLAFVGYAKVQKSADRTVTVNRIRGLANANTLYAGDHNGKYVPVFSFDEESRADVQWHYNQTFLRQLIGATHQS